MKILVAGDTHANTRHLRYLFRQAEYWDVSHIVQLGDFGYWPKTEWGKQFLFAAQELALETGIDLLWIDGNHEDHDSLDEMIKTAIPAVGGQAEFGFLPTMVGEERLDNVNYSPRGNRWNWGGVEFGSLGGAFSVDRSARVEGESWFEREMIADWEVDRLIENGPPFIDVLFTHDVPSAVDILDILWRRRGVTYKNLPKAAESRQKLQAVADRVEVRCWIHGHYHVEYEQRVNDTVYRGLANDGTTGFSWHVLYLDDLL